MKRISFLWFLVLVSVLLTMSCANECANVICRNGGICVVGTCDCPEGFSGELCEIKDLCLGITCDYDGECIDGDCLCRELTQDYISGSWLFENTIYIIAFDSDGSFIDTEGNITTYTLNGTARTIDVFDIDGDYISTYNVIEDGFDCNKMNLISELHTGEIIITALIRQ